MRLERIFISLLVLIFYFFVLICPAFGHIFNKDGSFVLNYHTSDTVASLKKSFLQNRPLSSGFSLYEDRWEKWDHFPILDHQGSPGLNQGIPVFQRDYVKRKSLSSPTLRRKIDYGKASIIGGLNLVAITTGFHEAIKTWGESKSRFHIKDDWGGDRLAQTDELSHFLWGYKMTQFLVRAYDWVGFSPKTSRTLSVCQSSLILTLVEYPIDAYNPEQGLGISDLIFDYLGVGMAVAKQHNNWLGDFDFKLSWKRNPFSENQTVFAQSYEEFDNFIYWVTYRAKLFFPRKFLCLGMGYSAARSGDGAKRELYGGVGLSIPDFASLFGRKAGEFSKFLEILYPNIHIKL